MCVVYILLILFIFRTIFVLSNFIIISFYRYGYSRYTYLFNHARCSWFLELASLCHFLFPSLSTLFLCLFVSLWTIKIFVDVEVIVSPSFLCCCLLALRIVFSLPLFFRKRASEWERAHVRTHSPLYTLISFFFLSFCMRSKSRCSLKC